MDRRRTGTLVAAGVALAAAIGVAVAARSGSDGSAAAEHPSRPPAQTVIVPGRPGESARVTDSDHVKAPDVATYNGADTAFVQMMIVHHNQALEMARLAPERAGDPELRALAARIEASQRPEVLWMQSWLTARKLPPGNPSHDHATMPGMQTPANMSALAGLTGDAFDRKFVTMMTDHHQGAVRMAGDVMRAGSDEQLREVAGEMSLEQRIEIDRLRQTLS